MPVSIVSLFSGPLSAFVPFDVDTPQAAKFTELSIMQDSGAPKGSSIVTLNWDLPQFNEPIAGEFLGVADGSAQTFETLFDPIDALSYTIQEVAGPFGGAGRGDTTLLLGAAEGQNRLTVVLNVNFHPGDAVRVQEGVKIEYFVVSSIDGSDIVLASNISMVSGFSAGALVQEAQGVTPKIPVTDFSIALPSGVIDLVPGQFTPAAEVIIAYQSELQDLDHLEVYRLPGSDPVTDTSRSNVLAQSGLVVIDNALIPTSVQVIDTLVEDENGENWTYYIYAVDDESSPNVSAADSVVVETIPTIPQNLIKQVSENQVKIFWDFLPVTSDSNTDGFNVYRSDGPVFDTSTAVRVNTTVIPSTTPFFDDSAGNGVNRRPISEVAIPVNGNEYTYRIESIDSVTSWDVGTENESAETNENLMATRAI